MATLSVPRTPTLDSTYSWQSNSAGAPLPHIPRRTISPPTLSRPSSSERGAFHLRNFDYSSGSPSSSGSVTPTGSTSTLLATAHSTRTKAPRGAHGDDREESSSSSSSEAYIPFIVSRSKHQRAPRTTVTAAAPKVTPTLTVSVPVASEKIRTVSAPTPSLPLRKNPALPLKSSLKHRRPTIRGDLSVVTGSGNQTKSEPSTPTYAKSVHFDTQLERVHVFVKGQRLSASAAGDESGTESDFPQFIYGRDEKQRRTEIIMHVADMRVRRAEEEPEVEVRLEELVLTKDGSSVEGRVRVRNLAFEKRVAVRFTFDAWQTTSEVTAHYVRSAPDGRWDWFAFSIRLEHLLGRIEEKNLVLAVKYSVLGREAWDNNDGKNYRVSFKKVPVEDKDTDARVTAVDHSLQHTHPAPLSKPAPTSQDHFDLRSTVPLSTRYDFSASLKTGPVVPAPAPLASLPRRVSPKPSFRPAETITFTRDPKLFTRGSPHIMDPESPWQYPASMESRRRRSGYFDLGLAAPVLAVQRGGSAESTPSVTSGSESSESSRTSSPALSPTVLPNLGSGGETSPVDTSNLHVLLNKYCFYTGPDDAPDVLQRSHSASSVEGLLYSYSPRMEFSPPRVASSDTITDAPASFGSRYSPVLPARVPVAAR